MVEVGKLYLERTHGDKIITTQNKLIESELLKCVFPKSPPRCARWFGRVYGFAEDVR